MKKLHFIVQCAVPDDFTVENETVREAIETTLINDFYVLESYDPSRQYLNASFKVVGSGDDLS